MSTEFRFGESSIFNFVALFDLPLLSMLVLVIIVRLVNMKQLLQK